jgi:hypothetical protein
MPRTCQVHSPNGVCSISWVSNDPFLPLLVDNRRDGENSGEMVETPQLDRLGHSVFS